MIRRRTAREKGITMLEVLVVMGILVIVGGFALFVSMQSYRSTNFAAERDILISVLQRARALSMNNVCYSCTVSDDGKPHGVHIQSDAFILFEGSVYDPSAASNVRFEANTAILHTLTAPSNIMFDQLSGNSTTLGDIGLAGMGGSSTTTITAEGRISWTN